MTSPRLTTTARRILSSSSASAFPLAQETSLLPRPVHIFPVVSARPAVFLQTPQARHYATRKLHSQPARQRAQALAAEHANGTNPTMNFPCLDKIEDRSATLEADIEEKESGPEPSYTSGATMTFRSKKPLLTDWGGVLQEFDIAYETWGQMNADKSNVILLHTGLSASSHAHSTRSNPQPGWWEKFIGPGRPVDTNKYFVICTNVLGSCYGSTGPSSIDPADGKPYATRFPVLTIEDMVRAQFRLLDHLGVNKLYASVGSSMGGMQSLAAGVLYPDRVRKIVSISGCARSHPYSIAMRHTQRQVLMMDPNWNRGYYYGRVPPHAGMKLAREIATVTYRSGPEWEQRFGRRRADSSKPPALCPDFLIETYLDHAGEKFCLTYDPNSLLYVSKAVDLFDLGAKNQRAAAARRAERRHLLEEGQPISFDDTACSLTLPSKPYEEKDINGEWENDEPSGPTALRPPKDLIEGLAPLVDHPILVMGVDSDILFPAWQQREIAEAIKHAGNRGVIHIELGEEQSIFGHDTFLLDLENIGGQLEMFLG